jgi:hypothetical protein
MITYEKLLKKPQLAKCLVGMTPVEFAQFYEEFESAHTKRFESSKQTRGQKSASGLCERVARLRTICAIAW